MKDSQGNPTDRDWVRPVKARLRYRLEESPAQPLRVDIEGRYLLGLGETERLALDNGVELTGRTFVHGKYDPNAVTKAEMIDVEQPWMGLYADGTTARAAEVDSVVFGVVCSSPLAEGVCTTPGWSSPGRPFLLIEGTLPEDRLDGGMRWINGSTLRIDHGDFEIWFQPTSAYWRNIVDTRKLQHDTIVGVRKTNRSLVTGEEFQEICDLLEAFIGWVNHCVSPVFHAKYYRKGRLVYQAYNLYPHATQRRDRYSWLPVHGPEGDFDKDRGSIARHAFAKFSAKWQENSRTNGFFHVALQLLKSKERGGPSSEPSLLYLQDVFGAIAILTSMVVGSDGSRGRLDTMSRCLRKIHVSDRIPDDDARQFLSERHPKLWWVRNTPSAKGHVHEQDRRNGTLARPMANIQNWISHLEDFDNAKMLLALGAPRPSYFVQLAVWLADLMILRVVEYEKYYLNRLTGKMEDVPWL